MPVPQWCDYCGRRVSCDVLCEESTHMCRQLAVVLVLYTLYRRFSDCSFLGPEEDGVLTRDTVDLLDAMVRREQLVHGRAGD